MMTDATARETLTLRRSTPTEVAEACDLIEDVDATIGSMPHETRKASLLKIDRRY